MASKQVSGVEDFVKQSLGHHLVLDAASGRILCVSKGVLKVLGIGDQDETRGCYIHSVLSGADLSDGVLSAKRWGSLISRLRKGEVEEVVLSALLRWERPRRTSVRFGGQELLGKDARSSTTQFTSGSPRVHQQVSGADTSSYERGDLGGSGCLERSPSEPIGGALAWGKEGREMRATSGASGVHDGRGGRSDGECPAPFSEKAERVSAVAWEITKGAKWGMLQLQMFSDAPTHEESSTASESLRARAKGKLVVTVFLPRGDRRGGAVCMCGSSSAAEPGVVCKENFISEALVEPQDEGARSQDPPFSLPPQYAKRNATNVWGPGSRAQAKVPRPPIPGGASRAASPGGKSFRRGETTGGGTRLHWEGSGQVLVHESGGQRVPLCPLRTSSCPDSTFPLESQSSISPSSGASENSPASSGMTGGGSHRNAAYWQDFNKGATLGRGLYGMFCGVGLENISEQETGGCSRQGFRSPATVNEGLAGGIGRVELNDENVVLSVNQAACDLLKCQPGDLEGRQMRQFMYPSDLEYFGKACQQLRLRKGTDEPWSRDWRFRRKDGVPMWLKMSPCPSIVPGSLAIELQDISAIKAAELRIMDMSEQFRSMVEALPVGAAHLDYQTGKIIMNSHVELILGYSKQELITVEQWVNNLFGNQAEETLRRFVQRQTHGTAQGTIGPRLHKMVRKDGQIRWLEFWICIYGVAAAPVSGEVWVLHDVTSYKHIETKCDLLFERSLAAQFLFTERKGIFDCNEAAVKMMGAQNKEQILSFSSPADFSAKIQE